MRSATHSHTYTAKIPAFSLYPRRLLSFSPCFPTAGNSTKKFRGRGVECWPRPATFQLHLSVVDTRKLFVEFPKHPLSFSFSLSARSSLDRRTAILLNFQLRITEPCCRLLRYTYTYTASEGSASSVHEGTVGVEEKKNWVVAARIFAGPLNGSRVCDEPRMRLSVRYSTRRSSSEFITRFILSCNAMSLVGQ